jgi:uncharacterized coiled-coil protein SlyX
MNNTSKIIAEHIGTLVIQNAEQAELIWQLREEVKRLFTEVQKVGKPSVTEETGETERPPKPPK